VAGGETPSGVLGIVVVPARNSIDDESYHASDAGCVECESMVDT
jgi:hypothetical protein